MNVVNEVLSRIRYRMMQYSMSMGGDKIIKIFQMEEQTNDLLIDLVLQEYAKVNFKLDQIKEVCDLTVISGLVMLENYVPDKAIYKIEQILKDK